MPENLRDVANRAPVEMNRQRAPRHLVRTELTDRDFTYLKRKLADRPELQLFTLGSLLRYLVNRLVSLDLAGEDIGVFPPRMEDAEGLKKRRA